MKPMLSSIAVSNRQLDFAVARLLGYQPHQASSAYSAVPSAWLVIDAQGVCSYLPRFSTDNGLLWVLVKAGADIRYESGQFTACNRHDPGKGKWSSCNPNRAACLALVGALCEVPDELEGF